MSDELTTRLADYAQWVGAQFGQWDREAGKVLDAETVAMIASGFAENTRRSLNRRATRATLMDGYQRGYQQAQEAEA